MPFQGFTRFRRHQVGKQSSFTSNTSATRRLPYRGAIVVDPARTDPDVDVGSIDLVMAPERPWTLLLATRDPQLLRRCPDVINLTPSHA